MVTGWALDDTASHLYVAHLYVAHSHCLYHAASSPCSPRPVHTFWHMASSKFKEIFGKREGFQICPHQFCPHLKFSSRGHGTGEHGQRPSLFGGLVQEAPELPLADAAQWGAALLCIRASAASPFCHASPSVTGADTKFI